MVIASQSTSREDEKKEKLSARITVLADQKTETTIKLPPPDFPIEFIEGNRPMEHKTKFDISADDEEAKSKETSRSGAILIYRPESKLKIALTTQKESPPPKKEQRRATNDEDILTPIKLQ